METCKAHSKAVGDTDCPRLLWNPRLCYGYSHTIESDPLITI